MRGKSLKQLEALGQSVWLDFIQRDLAASGRLKRLIDDDGLRGMTSNPAIFEKAIGESGEYDNDVKAMTHKGMGAKDIYEALTQGDVRAAADEFKKVYERTDAKDGYVSLEVNPHLAHDAKGTMIEARRLWSALKRPNVLIKVPATLEGLQAIKILTGEGININVTLLFGLPRYQQVAEAYIAGLEERVRQGGSVKHVASVASFFLSRIDILVDKLLEKIISAGGYKAEMARAALGKTAVASAKRAYQIFKAMFGGERFLKLAGEGACPQRLLWASTSCKNPACRDVKYIEELAGPETVSTIPLETMDAFRDHGVAKALLESETGTASVILENLAELGIDIDAVAQQLEDEGIVKFNEPFDKLMAKLSKPKASKKPARKLVLSLNGGAANLKFALFDASGPLKLELEGRIDRIGEAESVMHVKGLMGTDAFSRVVPAQDHKAALDPVLDLAAERCGAEGLCAAGHRIAHGGPKFSEPQLIDAGMIVELLNIVPFAPSHLPGQIAMVDAIHLRFPKLPQVACFDTAFHHGLPRMAQLLPIPRRYEALGMRRYGFHGLSCEYLIGELAALSGAKAANGRIILAHLGNEASLAAVGNGKPIDSSMGFTPGSGIPMGVCSGDLDPGVAWHLARAEAMDAKQFNEMATAHSGLLGVSETSSDMLELLESEKSDLRAAEAVALFCYQVKLRIGAFAAALGGLDALVFAGGIGENSPVVRARICEGLAFLGIELDEKLNAANESLISKTEAKAAVRVIHADEELMTARLACRKLGLDAEKEH